MGSGAHVTFGSLVDVPARLPEHHIFVGSKAHWEGIRDELRRYEGHARSRGKESRLGTVAHMPEVVETYDLMAPSQDGWAVDYLIRREDGEELHAEVRCWERAKAAAERAANAEALAAIAATLPRSRTRS